MPSGCHFLKLSSSIVERVNGNNCRRQIVWLLGRLALSLDLLHHKVFISSDGTVVSGSAYGVRVNVLRLKKIVVVITSFLSFWTLYCLFILRERDLHHLDTFTSAASFQKLFFLDSVELVWVFYAPRKPAKILLIRSCVACRKYEWVPNRSML